MARIRKGSYVKFHYELRDERGQLIESTFGGEPLDYVHGEGQLIDGLEAYLENEEPGFVGRVTVPPEKAYGVHRPELVVYAGPENFDDGVELREGEVVETTDPDGNVVQFRIVEVQDDKVYLDGNHPLAGKTLEFKVEVVEVS